MGSMITSMNSTVSKALISSSTADLKKFIHAKEKAIAKEKRINYWRTVAIVIMGLIISIGLAILSDAALSHSIFLGGVGLTVMITAVQYYKNQSERKITQLKQEQQLLIKHVKKRIAMTASGGLSAPNVSIMKKQGATSSTAKLSTHSDTFLHNPEALPGLEYVDGIKLPL